jgi:hypothetical protein
MQRSAKEIANDAELEVLCEKNAHLISNSIPMLENIHTTASTYGIGIYQMRCTAYIFAPEYRLIQSETCRASNRK